MCAAQVMHTLLPARKSSDVSRHFLEDISLVLLRNFHDERVDVLHRRRDALSIPGRPLDDRSFEHLCAHRR